MIFCLGTPSQTCNSQAYSPTAGTTGCTNLFSECFVCIPKVFFSTLSHAVSLWE